MYSWGGELDCITAGKGPLVEVALDLASASCALAGFCGIMSILSLVRVCRGRSVKVPPILLFILLLLATFMCFGSAILTILIGIDASCFRFPRVNRYSEGFSVEVQFSAAIVLVCSAITSFVLTRHERTHAEELAQDAVVVPVDHVMDAATDEEEASIEMESDSEPEPQFTPTQGAPTPQPAPHNVSMHVPDEELYGVAVPGLADVEPLDDDVWEPND